MSRWLLVFAIAASLALVDHPARGQSDTKSYSTSFVTFQIPASWACELEGTEFVCHESGRDKGLSMLAIIAAKVADPSRDNPTVYISELGQPREWKDSSGKLVISRLIASGTRCIGGHTWYWSKQLGSELRNYYTEYFAALQSDIAVLVTVSYLESDEAEGRPIARTIASNLRPSQPAAGTNVEAAAEANCSGEN